MAWQEILNSTGAGAATNPRLSGAYVVLVVVPSGANVKFQIPAPDGNVIDVKEYTENGQDRFEVGDDTLVWFTASAAGCKVWISKILRNTGDFI